MLRPRRDPRSAGALRAWRGPRRRAAAEVLLPPGRDRGTRRQLHRQCLRLRRRRDPAHPRDGRDAASARHAATSSSTATPPGSRPTSGRSRALPATGATSTPSRAAGSSTASSAATAHWKIAHRRTVFDWNRDTPSSEGWCTGVFDPVEARACSSAARTAATRPTIVLSCATMPTRHPVQEDLLPLGRDARRAARRRLVVVDAGRRARALRPQRAGTSSRAGRSASRTVRTSPSAPAAAGRGAASATPACAATRMPSRSGCSTGASPTGRSVLILSGNSIAHAT